MKFFSICSSTSLLLHIFCLPTDVRDGFFLVHFCHSSHFYQNWEELNLKIWLKTPAILPLSLRVSHHKNFVFAKCTIPSYLYLSQVKQMEIMIYLVRVYYASNFILRWRLCLLILTYFYESEWNMRLSHQLRYLNKFKRYALITSLIFSWSKIY